MPITMQEALQRTIEHREIFHDEMLDLMRQIMSGQMSPVMIAAITVGLRVKKETIGEITAAAQVMRELATQVTTRDPENLVDIVGTGGDGAHTFNISTASMFVCAAAGARVAKHGNRAVSSQSGSADVLERLGFELDLSPTLIAESIDELGFGFMFAPAHHPAMRHAGPVRTELATRTVFNVLGPLTNPAGARAQVVGVYSADLVPVIADVLTSLGARRAFVVHGFGGIDELSPAGANLVCEVVDGDVHRRELDPLDLGIARCDPAELRGGTADENASGIRAVFAGADGGRRAAILLNAAGAIAAAGHAPDLAAGLGVAREALDSGAAGERLEELAAFSRRAAGT